MAGHFEDKSLNDSIKVVEKFIKEYELTNKSESSSALSLPNSKHDIFLYTDGACRGNPGPGSWACLSQIKDDEILFQSSGVDFNTTNNKMEMTAVVEGLNRIKESTKCMNVAVYTDSKYIVDGMKSWVSGWKKRGWKKADKKEPENLVLWKELDSLNDYFENLEFNWVKGHNGHPQNELCDQLCNKALDEVI